jgi:hypothetical protein
MLPHQQFQRLATRKVIQSIAPFLLSTNLSNMNKILKYSIFPILTFFLMSLDTFAQDGNYFLVRDLEVWSAAKLKYKINKNWAIGLDQQFRFNDNASTIDNYFTELDIKRKLGKHFSTAMGARYIKNNDTQGSIQGYETFFRWNSDVAFKHKVKRFLLQYRVRYQAKNELVVEDESNKTFRFQFESEYNIKKSGITPQFSTEIFNDYGDHQGFNKIRFTLGTTYKLKTIGKITAFFRMEKELLTAYPVTTNIIGIAYQYTFKHKKK